MEEPKSAVEAPKAQSSAAMRQPRIPQVNILYFISSRPATLTTNLFRKRLYELGYVEGKNVLIKEGFANGDAQRLTELAQELAAGKVDVIVSAGIAATVAARQTTSTIPIVMVQAGDPIRAGVIASLARPGGNVTGTMNLQYGDKQVGLMRQLVPGVTKLAILVSPTNADAPAFIATATEAANKFNIEVVVNVVTGADDFTNVFAAIRSAHSGGLIVATDPFILTHAAEVREFAATTHLPAIYDVGDVVRHGGLIAFGGGQYIEHYALAADYVDKILKGAKPADLPVQQPLRSELVINLKAAKELGITIPLSFLVLADEVIR